MSVTASAATATVSGTAGTPASEPLSDCAYEQQLQRAALPLALAVLNATQSVEATPSPASQTDAVRAYDQAAAATAAFLATLRSFDLPPDLRQYNDHLVAAYQAAQAEVQQARDAAAAGDAVRAAQLIQQATAAIQAAPDAANQALPQIAQRLQVCGT